MYEEDYAVKILSDFIKINTSNPPGNEEEAVEFLDSILTKEGLETQIYLPVKKRANLLSKIKGRKKGKPIVLLSHIDVVPANPDEWDVHPFSGEIKDGFIYGRGAIDMKSQTISQLFAFIDLYKKGIVPERDLIFLATCDEEVGGKNGIEYMLNEVKELQEASFVLSEGGSFIEENGFIHAQIAVAEKKISQFMLKAHGQGGHGSMPSQDSANEKVIKASYEIISHKWPIKVTGVVNSYLNGILKDKTIEGVRFNTLKEGLKNKKIREALEANPLFNALLRNTVVPTILKSGEKINVIPSEATIYFDARLLPQENKENFFSRIKKLCGKDVEVIMLDGSAVDPKPSSYNTEYFKGIKETIRRSKGDIPVLPCLLTGASDLRYFRNLNIPAYGFFPAVFDKEEILKMHGKNERISVENFINAIEMTKDIVNFLAKCR
ncbi:MAG TPA: M20/M25/M40 family metallo-hydrolase [Syntrophorhabdaceae bacterium]|nr:M20/M25/M40 family metallo-hydrolase [Syntrophorhabdaceae bacterium]HPU29410.1 M20/M25/M40 family metallo-hydrolase [Syntrophorhabdaceae bacterium]